MVTTTEVPSSTNTTNDAANIPTLEGVCFDLTTSPGRYYFRAGHRAWFWIAESGIGVPDEFEFVRRGVRFRLKKDGPLECRLVYCKLYSSSNIDRQRERYFYPVRIVSIDGGARQSAA